MRHHGPLVQSVPSRALISVPGIQKDDVGLLRPDFFDEAGHPGEAAVAVVGAQVLLGAAPRLRVGLLEARVHVIVVQHHQSKVLAVVGRRRGGQQQERPGAGPHETNQLNRCWGPVLQTVPN